MPLRRAARAGGGSFLCRRTVETARKGIGLAGKYIADHCDALLAVWDGNPQQSVCGTEAVVFMRAKSENGLWIVP